MGTDPRRGLSETHSGHGTEPDPPCHTSGIRPRWSQGQMQSWGGHGAKSKPPSSNLEVQFTGCGTEISGWIYCESKNEHNEGRLHP